MAITVTDKAAKHIGNFLTKRGSGIGLRLGVRTTGCSGMAYKLEFVDEAQDGDLRFDSNGVSVFVDPKSLSYLDGMELDFAREGLNEGDNVIVRAGAFLRDGDAIEPVQQSKQAEAPARKAETRQ